VNDLLHPTTKRQIESFIVAPSHAVLLVGPSGVEKSQTAIGLAEQLLQTSYESYPYKLQIAPEDKKSISIEQVRQLEHFLSLKVPSQAAINRIVIIEDAHLLTLEAQNALLKTLEEPPGGSLIILSASHDQALLPTIRSRLQVISVKRPEKASVKEYFRAEGYDSAAIEQAYVISSGLPGVMRALLDNTDHPLLIAVEQARQLLSRSTYERLQMVDELTKQRELALDTAGILQQMAEISMQTATGAAAKKWQKVLAAGYHAAEDLSTNAQPKLALTRLMLNL